MVGRSWAPRWWGVGLIGLALWIAAIAVALITSNAILLPTVVLVGSFLVPVTAVIWYLDHDPSPALPPAAVSVAAAGPSGPSVPDPGHAGWRLTSHGLAVKLVRT